MIQSQELDEARTGLARMIVGELPKFGHWAAGFREFKTPYGNVGYRQLSILWALRHELSPPDASTTWFAHHFDVQPSVMTRALAKLERAEFILRERDPHDNRRIHVTITERGKDVSAFVERRYVHEVVTSMEALTDCQIAELRRNVGILGELADTLEQRRNRRPGRLN